MIARTHSQPGDPQRSCHEVNLLFSDRARPRSPLRHARRLAGLCGTDHHLPHDVRTLSITLGGSRVHPVLTMRTILTALRRAPVINSQPRHSSVVQNPMCMLGARVSRSADGATKAKSREWTNANLPCGSAVFAAR